MLLKKYFVFTYFFAYNIKYGLLASCNRNVILSKCANKLCGYTNCTQIDQPVVCVESSTVVCQEGCICKDKYMRADNGTCIPYTQCPNYGKCTKENEYYDLCPSPCISRVCGVNKLSTNCSDSSDSTCLAPACICKVGFYRNNDGNCVVASLCGSNTSLATTTSTETQSSEATTTMSAPTTSISSTATSSATLSTMSTTTTQSYNNTSTQRCGRHEKYIKNPCTLCQPFTCSQLGFPLACVQSNYSSTCSLQPGCFCIKGYVRNDHNFCLPIKKCPSCGGDVNAESGCTVICPTCEDYWHKRPGCSRICKLNGCGCKRGYVYDTIQKTCVLLRNYCSRPLWSLLQFK